MKIPRSTLFWLVVASGLAASSVAQATSYLRGTVTLNSSAYTKNASVSLWCSKQSTSGSYYYNYQSCSDWGQIDSQGNYSFDSSEDSYNCCASSYASVVWDSCQLYAYPSWDDQSVASSEYVKPSFNCREATTQDLALRSKDRTIELTITAGSQVLSRGMSVNCWQNSGGTSSYTTEADGDGKYRLPVTEGTFTCSASCDWSTWQGNCPYSGYPQTTVSVDSDDTTVSATLNFTTKDKTIHVSVLRGSTPVTEDIGVSCTKQSSPWTYASSYEVSESGTYDLLVTEGYFSCYSWCNNWPCSGLTGNPFSYVTVGASDTEVNATLRYEAKDKTIKTRIVAGGQQITSGVTVSCSEQGGSWSYVSDSTANSDGNYECAVGTGTYSVYAYNNDNDGQNRRISGSPQGKVVFEEDDEETSAEVTLTFLENSATVSGVVTDGTSGVANVWISLNATAVASQSGASATRSSVVKALRVDHGSSDTTQVYISAQTRSDGGFETKLPPGTYSVCANPPYDRKDLGQKCQEVTAVKDVATIVNISLSKKTARITGCVTDAKGQAIRGWIYGSSYNGAAISGDWFSTQLDSSGCYDSPVIEGYTYNVSASVDTWSDPSATYCNNTNEGMQAVTATSSAQTVNFTVPNCNCNLTVSLLDTDGEGVAPVRGSLDCRPSSFSSNESYYSVWGEVTNGIGTAKVQPDRTYTCKAWIWDWESDVLADTETTCTCTDGSGSCQIGTKAIVENAVSGGYVDSSGSVVSLTTTSWLSVSASMGNNYRSCTASSSGYSCDLSEGEWVLSYWIDPSSGYASSSAGLASNRVTVTSAGGITQDLTLLNTATIDCSVLNLDGSVRTNVSVECCPYSAGQEGANDYQYRYGCNWGYSGSDGVASLQVGATTDGVDYYCNAYLPYNMKSSEGINNPEEQKITAIAGETATCTLAHRKTDGTSVITVTEGDVAVSALSLGTAHRIVKDTPPRKLILNAEETEASNPIAYATVDCFTPAGGSFEVVTDELGVATCPCTTEDTWYAVAHNMVGNAIYTSAATEITCSTEGGSGTLAIDYVTTAPEGDSQTSEDPVNEAIVVELSDGFSVTFGPGSLSTTAQTVTCNAEAVQLPFTANGFQTNFYGYSIQCLDANNVPIKQLNSPATFVMPYNKDQAENLGLTENDIQCVYWNEEQGKNTEIPGATIDEVAGVKFTITHLTNFALVGNGYLGGIQGEDGGAIGKSEETGASGGGAAAASGCGGCYLLGAPSSSGLDDRILWGILMVLYGLRVRLKKQKN